MSLFTSPRCLAPWLLALLLPGSAFAQGASGDSAPHRSQQELTLQDALTEAFARSPALRAAAAEVDEARGRLLTARTFPNNPELETEIADRQGIGNSSTDFSIALTQEIEVGGQRGKRVKAAAFELESLEAALLRERRLLAASVVVVFGEAIAAGQLSELATTETELAREFLGVTERRFEAGAATQVDLNLGRASTARSERRREMAAATALEARSLLAEVVGLDPAAPPSLTGELSLPEDEPPSVEVLVSGALERRADLASLEQSLRAAEARLVLERANRIPGLSFGAFYEEEEGTDRIVGGGLRISLPFFNRNQGGIAEAEAAIDRSTAGSASRELTVRREVYSALTRYRAARASAEKLAEGVVGNLADSLDLLQRSFAAGKIGLSELLVLRRELIEGRRESIEAQAMAWIARAALDLAVGRTPAAMTPPSNDSMDPTEAATQEPSR